MNESCDESGQGEGASPLGLVILTTDGSGHADINATFPPDISADLLVTATAFDPDGNTSEFSNCVQVIVPATPTPMPSPTGPTPTGGTPTVTPAPTSTATATPIGTPTPTPTSTPMGKLVQGDVQCDGDVDTVDALQQLRNVAALETFQEAGCPGIGAKVASLFGDVDCDEDVDAVDALMVLRWVAALTVSQFEPCKDIGKPL